MSSGHAARGEGVFAALAGTLCGTAWQLQQARLWEGGAYAALAGAGLLGWLALRPRRAGGTALLAALVLGALLGAGLAGGRATLRAADALVPALEGRDLQVVGVVAQMPQRNEAGVRFRLDVESARWADAKASEALPQVPARIAIGWYAENTGSWGRATTAEDPATATLQPLEPLHAGERWRFIVRLKAPHGNLNPHGFDYELWLWEQGLQATGYVRSGKAADAAPERIGSTWSHPVERAREAVRDAIFERVSDRKLAGVIAALVTGDQGAIDRADWDVFRATGVAHLMSISGLHITMCAWF